MTYPIQFGLDPKREWELYIIAGQSNAGLTGTTSDLSAGDQTLQPGTRQWDCYLNNDETVILKSTHIGFARPNHATNFGAALEFSRTMKAAGRYAVTVAVAVSGTGLATRWLPVDTGLYATQLIPAIVSVMSKLPSRVSGIYWNQGETDASSQADAEAYTSNLGVLMGKLRSDYGASLPVVLSRLHISSDETYAATVRAQQVAWVAGDTNAVWFDVDDLALKVDSVHFTSAAQVTAGQRAAASMLGLL